MLISSRGRNNKFKQKLDMWGFQKNLKPRQSRFIRRNAKRGRAEGKKIEFRIKHGKVPPAKVQRLLKARQYASLSNSVRIRSNGIQVPQPTCHMGHPALSRYLFRPVVLPRHGQGKLQSR